MKYVKMRFQITFECTSVSENLPSNNNLFPDCNGTVTIKVHEEP